MLQVRSEINSFWDLEEMCWSGALYTLNEIKRKYKEDELMQHLEEVFGYDSELPDITSLNDYLWFEDDAIFEALGIKTNEQIQNEIDEVEAEIADLTEEIQELQELEENYEYEQEQLEELQERLEELQEELGA